MIELYEHNEKAYRNVMSMFATVSKVAVIHLNGTGKSFIGFKLCEDNPDATICWVLPSDYIFKTQIENLKKVTNGYAPSNIKFYTYAKLMLMTEEEILDINSQFFILDEFHRCGAKK